MSIEVSKKIYIRHKPRVIKREGEHISDADSNRYIGSALTSGGDVLRGLSSDEEERYLPRIVGTTVKSERWETLVKNYWNNIRFRVPPGNIGLELEIGFSYPNEEAMKIAEASDDHLVKQKHGEPINVANYILWRYCLVYGRVANTLSEVNNSPKITFYLYSKDAEVNDKYNNLQLKKKAYATFLSVLGDRQMVDDLLQVYNDPLAYKKGKDKEKDINLQEYVDTDSSMFISRATDPALKTRALIERAITGGHLRRVDNTDIIIYGDNTHIGNNMNDAIAFLNNAKNSAIFSNLKAKLQVITPTKQDAAPVVTGSEFSTPAGVVVSDIPSFEDEADLGTVLDINTKEVTQLPPIVPSAKPTPIKATNSK